MDYVTGVHGDETPETAITNTAIGITKEQALYLTMTLQREGKGLAALIIYPSYILMALTLASMVLNFESCSNQVGVICFSVIVI